MGTAFGGYRLMWWFHRFLRTKTRLGLRVCATRACGACARVCPFVAQASSARMSPLVFVGHALACLQAGGRCGCSHTTMHACPMCCMPQLHPGVDLAAIAASCHGYSGADLAAVAREAALRALTRAAGDLHAMPAFGPPPSAAPAHNVPSLGATGGGAGEQAGAIHCVVEAGDFGEAMRRVGPSIVRGMEVEVPHTRCAGTRLMVRVRLHVRVGACACVHERVGVEMLHASEHASVLSVCVFISVLSVFVRISVFLSCEFMSVRMCVYIHAKARGGGIPTHQVPAHGCICCACARVCMSP